LGLLIELLFFYSFLKLLHNWQFDDAELYKNMRTRTAGKSKTHMNATSQLIALFHGQLYGSI
jgi:hypothetical protein